MLATTTTKEGWWWWTVDLSLPPAPSSRTTIYHLHTEKAKQIVCIFYQGDILWNTIWIKKYMNLLNWLIRVSKPKVRNERSPIIRIISAVQPFKIALSASYQIKCALDDMVAMMMIKRMLFCLLVKNIALRYIITLKMLLSM